MYMRRNTLKLELVQASSEGFSVSPKVLNFETVTDADV
jgi:hypothetical protein